MSRQLPTKSTFCTSGLVNLCLSHLFKYNEVSKVKFQGLTVKPSKTNFKKRRGGGRQLLKKKKRIVLLFQNLLQYKILQNAPIREKFTSQQSRNLNVIKRKGERMEDKKLEENLGRSSEMPAEKMRPSTLKLSFAEDKCHFRYISLQEPKVLRN